MSKPKAKREVKVFGQVDRKWTMGMDVSLLMTIIEHTPKLTDYPPTVVHDWLRLLQRYAPTVASEPLIVGPVLVGILLMGSLDIERLEKLIALDGVMKLARGPS